MSNSNWEVAAKAIMNPGFKIRCTHWSKDGFVYYENGQWCNQDGRTTNPSFSYGDWQEHKEPKPEKKFRVEKRYMPLYTNYTTGSRSYKSPENAMIASNAIGYAPVDVYILEGDDESK